jgi:hypothetical protein
VASKSNDNEQIDAETLRTQKDILRADDIMPPYKKTGQEDKSRKPSEEKTAEAASTEQEKGGMPRFDLAEEIMAEQRKISAIKRKAPGERIEAQKAEKEVEPVSYTMGPSTPAQPYQQKIIAEIVARDIESLFRGGNLGNSR